MESDPQTLVGVIMGSETDWAVMEHASNTLTTLGVPHEAHVRSAHRLPDLLAEYCRSARARGLRVIIAGAGGGAAHLPGMAAAQAGGIPVIGVPVDDPAVASVRDMPRGTPVAAMATGAKGAENAAVLAAQILAYEHPEVARLLSAYQDRLRASALEQDARVHGSTGSR